MSVVETLTTPQPGQVAALPVDQVHPSPDNVRSDLGDVSGLAKSIKDQGLLQPIVVHKTDDGAGWTIIAGHRRHAAHLEAGLDTIDSIIREGPSDGDATAARMVENLQRQDLPVADEARGYARLSELGWSQRRIAEAVGFTQSHVSKRIVLAEVPDDVLAGVSDGTARVEDAINLGRLMRRDPERAEVVFAQWRRQPTPWMLESAGRELAAMDREQQRTRAIDKARKAHELGQGPPVIDDIANTSYSSLRSRGMAPLRSMDLDRDQAEADGTLAVAFDGAGTAIDVCTDVARYEPADDHDLEEADDVVSRYRLEQEAKRAREDFIRSMLADPDPPPAHQLLVRLLEELIGTCNGETVDQIARTLGIDVAKSARIGDKRAAVLDGCHGDPPSNAQVDRARTVAWTMLLLRDEDHCHGHYMPPRPRQRAHLQRLAAAGYELSDVETEWLDASDEEDDADG